MPHIDIVNLLIGFAGGWLLMKKPEFAEAAKQAILDWIKKILWRE